ncbi:MAG: CinA family protein [Sphaerochaetaceae bacterium]|nr:CinA family protein [Sphaerochaetaceae bacterium]
MFEYIFDNNDLITLEQILRDRNETITTAESCTGGLIAHLITSISGSSDIFNGALVSYSNEIKQSELGVDKDTIIEYGVVSKEVVSQMLQGIISKFDADYAIAVSGVAGPGGGTKNKPVGMVVIGIMSKKNKIKEIDIYRFKGDRKSVQIQSAKEALKKILQFLEKSLDK